MFALSEAALAGDRSRAEKINAELLLLHKRLFLESNLSY